MEHSEGLKHIGRSRRIGARFSPDGLAPTDAVSYGHRSKDE
jgi:hypothetical protein